MDDIFNIKDRFIIISTIILIKDYYDYIDNKMLIDFLNDVIFMIKLFFYDISELRNYWFNIYYKYYIKKLNIEILIYNPYLLIFK